MCYYCVNFIWRGCPVLNFNQGEQDYPHVTRIVQSILNFIWERIPILNSAACYHVLHCSSACLRGNAVLALLSFTWWGWMENRTAPLPFSASFEENKPNSSVTIISLTGQASILRGCPILYFIWEQGCPVINLNATWQEQNSPFSTSFEKNKLTCPVAILNSIWGELCPTQHAIIGILHEKNVQDCAVTFSASFEENKPNSPVTILSLTQQVSIWMSCSLLHLRTGQSF